MVECDPLPGAQLMYLATEVHKGQDIPRRAEVMETLFGRASTKVALRTHEY